MPPPESVEDRPETDHDDDPEMLPPEPPFWAGEQCDLFPDDDDEMESAALEKTFASNGTVTAKKPGWSEGDHPRGQPDNAGQFGAGGGGASSGDKPSGGGSDKPKPGKPSGPATGNAPGGKPKKPRISDPDPPPERFGKTATGRLLVNAEVTRWCEEGNEAAVAKALGGKSLPDSEPMDVVIPPPPDAPTRGIELKTMIANADRQITMKSAAQARKRSWRRKHKVPVDTVVFDDTAVFNARGPGQHDLSKRRVFYRRGFGSFKVDGMHEVVGGLDGLQALIDTPTKQLPPGAWKPKKEKAVGAITHKDHGPPPHPGLVFDQGSHRWVRPEDHAPVGDKPAADDHAAKWLTGSDLPPEQKAKYHGDLTHVLGRMPPAMREAAVTAVGKGKPTFHPNEKAVNAECARLSGKRETGVVGFVRASGAGGVDLHLDGGATARGVYAHELGHAVDADHYYSDKPGWQAAWKSEIIKGRHLLSTYARTKPAEGFAEFHRALVEHGAEAVKERWPKCFKFLQTEKLV